MIRFSIARCRGFALGVLVALAACQELPRSPSTSSETTLSAERIAALVSSADRTAADRNNDLRRKPEAMLAFIGIRPGMVALDVSAGGGYTTELLARAIGPTGTVYGQRPPPRALGAVAPPAQREGESRPDIAPAPAPAAPASGPARNPVADRADRLRSAGVAAAPIVAVIQPFENPVPAGVATGRLDLVTLMFNYHDMGHLGVDRAAMNRAIFESMRPGGVFVIADHAGRPGTGITESGTLHRVEETFVREEVEAAGFRLQAEGKFLRNPNDPRDRNTPEPAQPKDEFVLKFVKP